MESNHQTETYKSLIQISLEGFRYLALLNGATWLSVLAFADKAGVGSYKAAFIKISVLLFILSLVLTGFCYLGSWLTQLSLHNENIGTYPAGRHRWPMWGTVFVFVWAIALYFVAAALALISM